MFWLENVDLHLRTSMSQRMTMVHNFTALMLVLSFPLTTPSRVVAGRAFAGLQQRSSTSQLSSPPHFTVHDISLQWRHRETRRKHQKS